MARSSSGQSTVPWTKKALSLLPLSVHKYGWAKRINGKVKVIPGGKQPPRSSPAGLSQAHGGDAREATTGPRIEVKPAPLRFGSLLSLTVVQLKDK